MVSEGTNMGNSSRYFNETLKLDHVPDGNSQYHRYFFFNILGSFTTVLIALISITGNVAVITASIWDETLRVQTGNILIMYLSAVDILTSLFVMFPSAVAVASDHWPLGKGVCYVQGTCNYLFACSSSTTIALINLDRAIAVTYPLKYRNIITNKVMFAFCFLSFVISTTVGLVGGASDTTVYDYTLGVCGLNYLLILETRSTYIIIYSALCCYFLPAIMIGTCNALILITAKKFENTVHPLFVRDRHVNPINDPFMRKSIKSMITVVVIYYTCFTPYAAAKQIKAYGEIDVPPWLNYMTTIFIFISSAVNPFIYAILRKDYREAFKKLPRMLARKCLYFV